MTVFRRRKKHQKRQCMEWSDLLTRIQTGRIERIETLMLLYVIIFWNTFKTIYNQKENKITFFTKKDYFIVKEKW